MYWTIMEESVILSVLKRKGVTGMKRCTRMIFAIQLNRNRMCRGEKNLCPGGFMPEYLMKT